MHTMHIRVVVGVWMCVFLSSMGWQEEARKPRGSVSDQALRSSSQQSGGEGGGSRAIGKLDGHTSVCLETALAPFPGSRVREPLFGNIPVMTGEACLP